MPLLNYLLQFIRGWIYGYIVRLAWLVADLLGWRAAMPVYPTVMRGKVAIVTGANSGLGFETTKALLQQGATVILACRTLEGGQQARDEILQDPRNHGHVGNAAKRLIPLKLDLEDFPSIKQFVSDFHTLRLPLHLLVNNAGVHLKPYARASLGFERTMACNYFSPFWLTQLLLEDLKASAPSRVVNTASIGEAWGIFGWPPYTLSIPYNDIQGYNLKDSGERPYVMTKTMLLMAQTRELARRLEGTGVDVIAIHPGYVNTNWYLKVDQHAYLFSWIIHSVRSVVGPWIHVGQSPQTGAISLIYASIDPALTGSTSNPHSFGLVDMATRMLFGGRLRYYGPSYIFMNWNNAGITFALNPWVYYKQACSMLYDASVRLVADVERQLSAGGNLVQQKQGLGLQQGLQQQNGMGLRAAAGAATAANGLLNGSVKTVPRLGGTEAPMGPSPVAQMT